MLLLFRHQPITLYYLRGSLRFSFSTIHSSSSSLSPSSGFKFFHSTLLTTTIPRTSLLSLYSTYFTTNKMESNTKDMDQLSLESKSMLKKKEKKEEKKFTLKTPKGTTDFGPEEMALRTSMFQKIQSIFERHGAVTIDTPVFELKELLQGKYGEDSKLIYDLEDQGGELCSLRYDLTVPFARFMAMHGKTYPNLKRYHIGKVYRRDQPAMQKGRRREFYQCDFDIAGLYDPMVPDAEILYIMVQILSTFFEPHEFLIKLNHRCILNAMFECCGVPVELFKSIASSIDKLDKCDWGDVKKEMLEKGLTESIANSIGEYVQLKGGKELLTYLKTNTAITSSPSLQSALTDMELLFEYLQVFGIDSKVSLDLSLARGLDYYTGVIFEAVLLSEPTTLEIQAQLQQRKPPTAPSSSSSSSSIPDSIKEDHSDTVGLGSIAAGGRYDDLVGMFMGPSKKGLQPQIPCVGMSIGVERLFSVLWQRQSTHLNARMKVPSTQVYVMAVGGDGLLKERMALCQELWHQNIATEFMYKLKPRLQAQFTMCEKHRIPLAIILGDEEVSAGVVKIKDMTQKLEGEESGGTSVNRSEMVAEVKRRLGMQ